MLAPAAEAQMAEHRFYVGEGLATAPCGGEVTLSTEASHRIARVLRLCAGDRIAVFGGGSEFSARILSTSARVRAQLLEPASTRLQPTPALTLYQGLIRPNRFEWLIEKGTELGVRCFVPVLSERCSVRAAEIGSERLQRWQRIATEATEQCGGMQPPLIAPLRPFSEALCRADGTRVVAWEALRNEPISLAHLRDGRQLSLFIGPEGGFSAAEIEQARATGAQLIGLGLHTLRAETAALAATALLLLG